MDNEYYLPYFEWKVDKKGVDFELFPNKHSIEIEGNVMKDSLFSFTNSKELSLIESHKEVDFFIKQNCYFSTSKLIQKMSKIPYISISYRLKNGESIENLNFEI